MTESLNKILNIEIIDKGKEILDLKIPLAIIHLVSRFAPEEELEKYGVNVQDIMNLIENSATRGKIVDFEDKTKKTRVKIYLD